jgi:hypothetical protein
MWEVMFNKKEEEEGKNNNGSDDDNDSDEDLIHIMYHIFYKECSHLILPTILCKRHICFSPFITQKLKRTEELKIIELEMVELRHKSKTVRL